jgi:lipopolysaccharide heptosyltransferase I
MMPSGPRIAIVKLSSIGDVVHALPVARALRRAWADAYVTWIVEAREHAVLRDHPDLDAVFAVDTRRWRKLARRPSGLRQAAREVGDARRRLRDARLDVVMDLQGLIKSGLIVGATRAPMRIGFARAHCREPLGAWFTNRHVVPPAGAHVVEQYLSLLSPLGIAPALAEFHVPVRPVPDRRMEDFLVGQGIKRTDLVVAMNPGAGRPDKRWPAERFSAVADRLATEANARILVLWGPNEVHLARAIRDALPSRAILAPPTDLDELTGLLRRSSLVIAGDTGPLHLGAALGAPCLGLYGPTPAWRNGPYGARCRALSSPSGAMMGLEANVVAETALAMLESHGARA